MFVKYLLLFYFLSCTTIPIKETRFKNFNTGESVSGLDHTWDVVQPFYGKNFPETILVKYHDSEFSGYEFPNIVWLGNFSRDPEKRTERFYEVIQHEISHLGNMRLTKHMSKDNKFRFIDEGFARLFENPSNRDNYFKKSIKTAKEYLKKEKVSFDLIQDWKTYFGDPFKDPNNVDLNTYEVGSTFVFFLINTYGEQKFKDFLSAIGDKKSLSLALSKVYNLEINLAEKSWIEFIRKH